MYKDCEFFNLLIVEMGFMIQRNKQDGTSLKMITKIRLRII
jgi:hypothetical protein